MLQRLRGARAALLRGAIHAVARANLSPYCVSPYCGLTRTDALIDASGRLDHGPGWTTVEVRGRDDGNGVNGTSWSSRHDNQADVMELQ